MPPLVPSHLPPLPRAQLTCLAVCRSQKAPRRGSVPVVVTSWSVPPSCCPAPGSRSIAVPCSPLTNSQRYHSPSVTLTDRRRRRRPTCFSGAGAVESGGPPVPADARHLTTDGVTSLRVGPDRHGDVIHSEERRCGVTSLRESAPIDTVTSHSWVAAAEV